MTTALKFWEWSNITYQFNGKRISWNLGFGINTIGPTASFYWNL